MENKNIITLAVIMAEDGKTVTGLGANVPLDIAFLAILAHAVPGAPRVDIKLVPASEVAREKPKSVKHPGVMDPALRARTDCPLIDTLAAKDMLSILSDKFLGGK